MSNDVKIKITAENDTNKTVSDVKSGMHDVETASDKAGNKVDEFAASVKGVTAIAGKAGTELDKFGVSSKSVKEDLAKLDKAALASKEALHQLTSALANTDDAAQRIDIKKAISKVQSDLNSTLKARKIKISELIDIDSKSIDNEGRSWSKKFMGALSAGFKGESGGIAKNLIPVLSEGLTEAGGAVSKVAGNQVGLMIGAAIGAAVGPTVISAISSALSAGTGLGVIGIGLVAAVKSDSAIQQAGKDAGAKFWNSVTSSADQAFKGPILESLNILSQEGDKAAAQLGKAFEALGPSIAPFTKDLAKAIDNVMTSFTNAASNSGPAIEGLGRSIVLLSDGVSSFIKSVADGGPEAAANLELIAGVIADSLKTTGRFIEMLDKASTNKFLSGPFLPILRDHYDGANAALRTFTKGMEDGTAASYDAADSFHEQSSALKTLSDDMNAQVDPVFALLNAEDGLAAAQKNVAKAVKEHGKNSTEAKAALRELTKAAIDLEGKTGDLANANFNELTPSLKATLHAAGLTDGQIKDVGRQFDDAKRKGNSFAKTYKAKIDADTKTAAQKVRDFKHLMDQVHSKKVSVSVVVAASRLDKVLNQLSRLGGDAYAHGGIKGAANGAMSSGMTLVGEHGPELLQLPPSTNIKSNPDTMRTLGQGGGSQTLILKPMPNGSRDVMSAIIEGIQVYVEGRHGGDVQRALGRARTS
jgi:hypothetical protein